MAAVSRSGLLRGIRQVTSQASKQATCSGILSRSRAYHPQTVAPLASVRLTSFARSFHVSAPKRGAGESDEELSSRLAQEISYEKESAAAGESGSDTEPVFLAEFRKAGVWKIEDQPGSDEIALTREFGNEHIRVLFSIGDIDTAEADVDENDEVGQREDEDDAPSFPVRCAITISKVRMHARLTQIINDM